MAKKKQPECDHHATLHIDCDRFTFIMNAIFSAQKEWQGIADKEDFDMLNAMEKELWNGIVEK